eukprot:UN16104
MYRFCNYLLRFKWSISDSRARTAPKPCNGSPQITNVQPTGRPTMM